MNKDITLVIVDTMSQKLANFSIEKTLSSIKCKEIITFSNSPIISGAKLIPIKQDIKIYDYSEIILKHLWLYLETDWVLVIQWDGMAINPHSWNDDFFNYDYIGAPWPWENIKVGNGGFSLRSRKLIESSRDTDIKLGTKISTHNEDIAICREYRPLLEQKYNIKFAPVDIAAKFSTENFWNKDSFGFHGIWNVPRFLNRQEIEYVVDNIPNYFWNDLNKTQELINVLVEQNYDDLAHKVYDIASEID